MYYMEMVVSGEDEIVERRALVKVERAGRESPRVVAGRCTFRLQSVARRDLLHPIFL